MVTFLAGRNDGRIGSCRGPPAPHPPTAKLSALAILGKGAKLDYLNFKPSPSLRVFDVAGGWSGWEEWRAVRRTCRKARSGGLTLGVSGSGVALALQAWTVAKTVPCRGRKRGNPSPGPKGGSSLRLDAKTRAMADLRRKKTNL